MTALGCRHTLLIYKIYLYPVLKNGFQNYNLAYKAFLGFVRLFNAFSCLEKETTLYAVQCNDNVGWFLGTLYAKPVAWMIDKCLLFHNMDN